jgi:hypothetical protein
VIGEPVGRPSGSQPRDVDPCDGGRVDGDENHSMRGLRIDRKGVDGPGVRHQITMSGTEETILRLSQHIQEIIERIA